MPRGLSEGSRGEQRRNITGCEDKVFHIFSLSALRERQLISQTARETAQGQSSTWTLDLIEAEQQKQR